MVSKVTFMCVCILTAIAMDTDSHLRLPTPRYEKQDTDPAWLQAIVQFHGHLGPSIVAGARFGMAGLHAVDAKGYFDVEVTCEGPFSKPPQSCFIDGLQVSTGATLGKRNLKTVDAEKIIVKVKNTTTGKAAEIRPTPELTELLAQLKSQNKNENKDQENGPTHRHDDMKRIEALARTIAGMEEKDIVTVKIMP
jgi:formylmethanofuran dehydrogenase subunit E